MDIQTIINFGAPFLVNFIVAILKRWISTKWAPLIVFALGGLSTLIGVGPKPGGEWIDMLVNTAYVSGGATLVYDLFKKLKGNSGVVVKSIIVFFMIAGLLTGCASIQKQWNTLTPQEQNRLVLNGIQKELNNLFADAQAYIHTNPKYEKEWVDKILPAFNLANKALKFTIVQCMTQPASLTDLLNQLQPLINDVKILLKGIGFKLPFSFLKAREILIIYEKS